MVIKSLTITENAYETLKRLKYGDESFSDVIIRVGEEKIGAAVKYFGALKMSEKEVEEFRARVKMQRKRLDDDLAHRAKKVKERWA